MKAVMPSFVLLLVTQGASAGPNEESVPLAKAASKSLLLCLHFDPSTDTLAGVGLLVWLAAIST